MKLSVVTTLYESTPHLEEFHKRILRAAGHLTRDFELIYVNDGSPDESLALALALAKGDHRVQIVDLSRNFGQHKAVMTGLSYARGKRVFLIDCDLEESPEWLGDFNQTMDRSRCDVVYGVQERRKGGWFERVSGETFYFVINSLCHVSIPRNILLARLMTGDYVKSLVAHREREIFLAGLWQITGYHQVPQVVRKVSNSPTTYRLPQKIDLAFDALTSFSAKPLVYAFYTGALITTLSLAFALYFFLFQLIYGTVISGWTSLIVSVWFLGGFIIFLIGLLGVYLSKVYSETKQRPYTIIRRVYQGKKRS
jgi:putative glycosyltransferase